MVQCKRESVLVFPFLLAEGLVSLSANTLPVSEVMKHHCNNDPHKYNLLFFKCLFSFDVISISEAFRGAVPGW